MMGSAGYLVIINKLWSASIYLICSRLYVADLCVGTLKTSVKMTSLE
jgi:hypothetical protein